MRSYYKSKQYKVDKSSIDDTMNLDKQKGYHYDDKNSSRAPRITTPKHNQE